MAQTDAYLAKYDPTEEGLKIVHAAYKDGTLSEPLYLEFTNDLNDRHIRKADPQTSDDSGAGGGLRGSVRGSDAARDEKPARGLRSSLLKGEFRSTTFTRRPLASWLDVREANRVPSKTEFTKKFEQRSAKSSETPEPQATPNQQEPGRSYPRRFEKLTRAEIDQVLEQVRLSQQADREWEAGRKAAREKKTPEPKTAP